MLGELISTSHGGDKRISSKYAIDSLNKEKARKIIPKLIEDIQKDNKVVNIYLYKNNKQKIYGNSYCRGQWSHEDAKYVPRITEDEIIHSDIGDIYIKWTPLHDELKDIIENE